MDAQQDTRPTVILLPGWFGSATGWGPGFADALDTGRYRYEFLDYRGYGDRRGSGGPYTLDQIAQDVLELADGLGAQRFALVGHSMGGSALQKVLTLAPERVLGVAGICPVPASGTPLDRETRALFESAAADDAARRTIIDITTGRRLSARFVASLVAHSREHSDEEAFAAYFRQWCDTDHQEQVPVDAVPALAVTGEHDPATTEQVIRVTWSRTFPGGRVEVLAGAGHYPSWETPVRLVTVLEEFLDGAVAEG